MFLTRGNSGNPKYTSDLLWQIRVSTLNAFLQTLTEQLAASATPAQEDDSVPAA